MVIFSITPHSASCERLFSSLGWIIGKRRTNLDVETIETMAKIYRTYLTHFQRSLNYGNSISENDIEQMLNVVFEEGDILNEDENEEVSEPESNEEEEETSTNEILGIEQVIDLGPWVFIDNTVLPNVNRRFNDSEDDDDWDPETLANNSNN
jgi:hypothetical protein